MNRNETNSLWLPGLGAIVLSGARPLFAIALALLASAGMIWASGVNPFTAYAALAQGAFGNIASLANTCVRATPLLLGGIGVAVGLKAGLLNVGVEGQIYAGGAAATAVGIIALPVSPWLHLVLAVLAGFLGGGLWATIPAYLRAYRGISEIVVTLMMNYIGLYFISWLVEFPGILAEEGAVFPQSPLVLKSAQLPILIRGTSLHTGLILGVGLAVFFFLLLRFSPFGFRTRMVGGNPEAAQYAGISVKRQILIVILVAGGMGGLAGTGEVLGLKLRLFDAFSGGVGYEAIAVALLANGNPLGVIFSALFFGALKAGANKMQIVTGIEASMAIVVLALAVLFVIAIGFGERKLGAIRKAKEGNQTEREAQAYGD